MIATRTCALICPVALDRQKETWDRWLTPGILTLPLSGRALPASGRHETLQRLGKSFVLLEASHRIGGRGYTEEILPGMPFDLGCHWLHSGSLNPFAQIADDLGIAYTKEGFPRGAFMNGGWVQEEDHADWNRFYERQDAAIAKAVGNRQGLPRVGGNRARASLDPDL